MKALDEAIERWLLEQRAAEDPRRAQLAAEMTHYAPEREPVRALDLGLGLLGSSREKLAARQAELAALVRDPMGALRSLGDFPDYRGAEPQAPPDPATVNAWLGNFLPGGAALGTVRHARVTPSGLRALLEEDPRVLSAVPDVPQFNLQRRWPPKGAPKSIAPLAEPANWERVRRLAEQGVEEGGTAWYNTSPLRQAAVETLGEAEGNAWFKAFMEYNAATSPRSAVSENIRRGSYFLTRQRQGHPPPVSEQPPAPYGHLAHKTQAPLIEQLQEGQPFNPMTQPKVASFSENLQGNYAPYTVDTHNARAWGLGGTGIGIERGPSLNEYPYLEQMGQQMAAEMGIAPAQHQAALWMGAAAETGVRDKSIWMQVFNNVLARTAKARDITPKKALDDFIRGKAPLLGLSGAGVLGLMTLDANESTPLPPPESSPISPKQSNRTGTRSAR